MVRAHGRGEREESIDSAFDRFNTIITSLKALDEGFSSKNYVRKFLRALHPKWRAKVTTIKESKDISSLALDELIGNLKVHEVVMEKESEIYRGKKERVKSIALKAKKESSDDETLISGSDEEEYAMAVRNFKSSLEERVCLRTCLEPDEWIKDSGCSKHMTGNKSLFSTYKVYDRGNVVFGSNLKGKIIGKGKTPYEIFKGRKPSLEYFKVFESKCFILNTKDYPTKFDPKSYEGVFLGYPQTSKAYIVLNKHTMEVEESLNVTFGESLPHTKLSPSVDDDVGEEEAIKKNTRVVNNNEEEDESIEVDEIVKIKESKNHPLDQVIGNLNQRTLKSQAQNHSLQIKQIEYRIFFNQSKYIKEMLKKFGLEDSKLTKTPMSMDIKLTKDVEADCVDSSNINKQTALAISTTKAEYVSAEKACQQARWIKQALVHYDMRLDDVPIMCYSKGQKYAENTESDSHEHAEQLSLKMSGCWFLWESVGRVVGSGLQWWRSGEDGGEGAGKVGGKKRTVTVVV
nr:zf-CCHC domain-containing protein/UBN2 domain-containing protein [Tanacetum cinerariifolium]